MANAIFATYKNTLLGSGTAVDLDANTIKCMFVDHADDTPNTTTDDFLDDIASAARVPAVGSAPTLANVTIGTVGTGVFDADDATFSSLVGDASESLILLKSTGADATSNLLAYWDTATGLPLTPNGGNVTVTWAAGGIISIA